MNQSTTHDFPSGFHSNYGPSSYRFQDEGQYLQNSPPPVQLALLLMWLALEFCTAIELRHLAWATTSRLKCDDVFVRLDKEPVLDRQTDRQN